MAVLAGHFGGRVVGQRLEGLDRLRGLAIVLMIVDHALALVAPAHVLRYTVTRAALPLFLLVAGSLLRRSHELRGFGVGWPLPRRLYEVMAAAGVATAARWLWMPWMSRVDVLVPIVLAMWCGPLLWKVRPGVVAAVCMVVVATFPRVWDGYHPAHVLGLLACGYGLAAASVDRWGLRAPSWLASVGRAPLLWYVGHLLVLAGLGSL